MIKRKKKKRKVRNRFESKIEQQLKKAKVKFSYESDHIPYIISGHYIPDFVVSTPSGKIYIEAKGYYRPEHKRKMAAVKKCNPNLDIRFVFYAKKTSDIRWAQKYGFDYAIGQIPREWLR